MSHYLAFPMELRDDLLAHLPPDERSVYLRHFESIIGDLVWVTADGENAVLRALERNSDQRSKEWIDDHNLIQEITKTLMQCENDTLISLVQEALVVMAGQLIAERQTLEQRRANEPDS